MLVPPGPDTGPNARAARQQLFPHTGFGRPAARPEQVLLVCYFDPDGISTVIETVAYMQRASRFSVTVLNVFEHRLDTGYLRLHPWLDLDRFDAVVIHNTVSYNVDNLRLLDRGLPTSLRDYRGVKVMMKQDENYRFRELAEYLGRTGFDVLLTCLPPEAVPLVYPPAVVGSPRIERMLTGYVTPTLRERNPLLQPRPIDIGYRGSIQPLTFGRLAYEKRKIGTDVARRLAGRTDVRVDISSRWEDRRMGDDWLAFLSSCKATLGAESGASIFDLNGDLERRCESLERQFAHLDEEARAEAVLAGLQDLEDNVHYHQVSPRHFEAIACGAVQLLYPGGYSGLLEAGRHYLVLERDGSNLDDLLAIIQDERARSDMARTAFEEVVMNPQNWIETFVARLDALIDETMRAKGGARREAVQLPAAMHVAVFEAHDTWAAEQTAPQGATLHYLRAWGEGTGIPQTDAHGSLRWSVPASADLGSLAGATHQGPQTAAAFQALLHLEHVAGLPQPQRCSALGLAPGLEPDIRLLDSLQAALAANRALIAAAARMRGVHAIVVRGRTLLPAALLAADAWAAPVILVDEREPGSRAERQWWQAWSAGLVANADTVADPADWPDALAPALTGRAPQPLVVFEPEPDPRYYVAPASSTRSGQPAVLRESRARTVLRGVWRRFPPGLKSRLAWLRRKLA